LVSSFILLKGDEEVKDFKEQLKQWKQHHQEVKQKSRRKPQKRKSADLSSSDIRSLMGMDRPRYGRKKGGAFRQK
jgi:hypothetical protein